MGKLFEEDGQYHKIWLALQADNELGSPKIWAP